MEDGNPFTTEGSYFTYKSLWMNAFFSLIAHFLLGDTW